MNRRDVLKGGLVVAASTPAFALAPTLDVESPQEEMRRLAWRLADLLINEPGISHLRISAATEGISAVESVYDFPDIPIFSA